MKLLPALLLAVTTVTNSCAAATISWDGDSTFGSSWFVGSPGDTTGRVSPNRR